MRHDACFQSLKIFGVYFLIGDADNVAMPGGQSQSDRLSCFVDDYSVSSAGRRINLSQECMVDVLVVPFLYIAAVSVER